MAGILFVGAGLLGAGTLKDLALALFIGIAAGTYSSIFIATPMLADLKEREPAMRALRKRVQARRSSDGKAAPWPASRRRGGQADAASESSSPGRVRTGSGSPTTGGGAAEAAEAADGAGLTPASRSAWRPDARPAHAASSYVDEPPQRQAPTVSTR